MTVEECKGGRDRLVGDILTHIQVFEKATGLMVRQINLKHVYDARNKEKHTISVDIDVEL